jgi:O-antigen/teichoic acid export membrane protein
VDSKIEHPPLRRQAPWVVGSRVIGVLAMLGANIVAARVLGPGEFGQYLFLFTVAVGGGILGTAGLGDALLRFSAENLALGRPQLAVACVRRVVRLGVFSTAIAAVVVAAGLGAFHLATGRLTQPILLVAVTVLALAALTWQRLASDALRGWHNLKLASLFSGGTAGGPVSTLLFLAALAGVAAAKVPVTAAAVLGLMAISVSLTVPFALLSVWRMTNRNSAHSIQGVVALSAPEDRQLLSMAGTVLVLYLVNFGCQQLDIWIGETFLAPDEFGMYGVAKRSMLLMAMPVQMAMLTIVSAIPHLHAQGRRRELQDLTRGAAGLVAVPSLAAMILLLVAPEATMQFVFGESYVGAAPMIRILAIGYLVLVLAGNPSLMLLMTGHHRVGLVDNLIAAAIIAIGGPLAAIRFGAVGIAWVSAGAMVIQIALQWGLTRWYLRVWTHVGLPQLKIVRDAVSRVAKSPENTTRPKKPIASPSPSPAGAPVFSGRLETS